MTDEELDGVVLGDEVMGELSEDDPAESAVFFALDEAATKVEEEGTFDPFLVVLQGEELFVEEQDGEEEEEIYESAKQTLFEMELLADAYVFCYDGYVDLDEGTHDAILVEWARKDSPSAQVLAWLYKDHEDHIDFIEPLYTLGEADSFFSSAASAASAAESKGEKSDGDAGATGDAGTTGAASKAPKQADGQ
ncbi:MAG: hypothetical protein FWF30_01285 [Coriobacteriia bacterium]|nr:hypothetical protein [Coriobacteriia bacterium]